MTHCQNCRWSSDCLPVDKFPHCHECLQSCQLTQQKGLRLTEHRDNYLSILADVMDESVLLTQACLKVLFLIPLQLCAQYKNPLLILALLKVFKGEKQTKSAFSSASVKLKTCTRCKSQVRGKTFTFQEQEILVNSKGKQSYCKVISVWLQLIFGHCTLSLFYCCPFGPPDSTFNIPLLIKKSLWLRRLNCHCWARARSLLYRCFHFSSYESDTSWPNPGQFISEKSVLIIYPKQFHCQYAFFPL